MLCLFTVALADPVRDNDLRYIKPPCHIIHDVVCTPPPRLRCHQIQRLVCPDHIPRRDVPEIDDPQRAFPEVRKGPPQHPNIVCHTVVDVVCTPGGRMGQACHKIPRTICQYVAERDP